MKNIKIQSVNIFLGLFLLFAGCKDGSGPTGNGNTNNNGNTSNQPPGAFNLLAPETEADSTDIRPVFSWEPADDPDGDPVQYDLFLDTEPDPATIVAEGLTDTEYTPEERLLLVTDYSWKVVAKDGEGGETGSDVFMFSTRGLRDAEQATDNTGFPSRDKHASVVFDHKLWVIAGLDDFGGGAGKGLRIVNFDDAWYSEDGVTWTEATEGSDERFPGRFFHAAAVFDDKIWVIGGVVEGSFAGDVWVSEDGASWTEIPQINGFTERAEHTVTVFNGKLWVIGGSTNGGKKLNDVWSSGDGANWELATDDAEFSARNFHQTVAFDGALWMIGGFDDAEAKNDVWRSKDGVTWTEITPQAGFSKRAGHRVAVFDDKLWLAGSSNTNDVWFSEDGETWKEATPQISWPVRSEFSSVVFDEKIWIMSGTGRNDVWYFDLN